jgi:hypothetical protein
MQSKCIRDSCMFQHDQGSNISTSSPTHLPLELVDGKIPVNAAGHRLDLHRPRPSGESWARFSARKKTKKLCTTFHLQKSCDETFCDYDHSPIDPSMRKCLEYVASHYHCKQGGCCRALKCTRSHICQRPRCIAKGGERSSSCQYPPRMHNIDFNIHEWVPAEVEDKETGGNSSDMLVEGLEGSFHGSANSDEGVVEKADARDGFGDGVVYDLIDL